MKSLALMVGLILAAFSWESKACSFQINDVEMKNVLISAAANEFNIGLFQASKIQVNDYQRYMEGVVPGSSCEKFMVFEADVVITYKKSLTETCELSTHVIRREDLHAESYPYYQHEFPTVASSCTFTPIVIKPPRRPIEPRRIRLN